jgi:hypothetical protein
MYEISPFVAVAVAVAVLGFRVQVAVSFVAAPGAAAGWKATWCWANRERYNYTTHVYSIFYAFPGS